MLSGLHLLHVDTEVLGILLYLVALSDDRV